MRKLAKEFLFGSEAGTPENSDGRAGIFHSAGYIGRTGWAGNHIYWCLSILLNHGCPCFKGRSRVGFIYARGEFGVWLSSKATIHFLIQMGFMMDHRAFPNEQPTHMSMINAVYIGAMSELL